MKSTNLASRLVSLKEQIENCREQRAQKEGALKQLLSDLKDKFKVDSVEEAEKLLRKIEKEIEEKERLLEEQLSLLEEELKPTTSNQEE